MKLTNDCLRSKKDIIIFSFLFPPFGLWILLKILFIKIKTIKGKKHEV